MGYWGKIAGGIAGFAMGGPLGAVVGAALGHAADSGAISQIRLPFGPGSGLSPARVAALFGRRDQLFAIVAVVLSAKLARVDGPVKREEIDAFKRLFRIPPESVQDVGRLFDQARDNTDDYAPYATQLGVAFAENRGTLEEVLTALFAIARADGPVNVAEHEFLSGVHRCFHLDQLSWDRARGALPRQQVSDEPDPYGVLGVDRATGDGELRAAWKRLMRENHPDSLTSRGVPREFVERATNKVAQINAAWDRIKRERGL